MTISTQVRTAGPFVGAGSPGPFAFAFKVFTAADLLVVTVVDATAVETTLTLTTHYTVALNADQDSTPGGSVTLVTPLPVGSRLVLSSQVYYTQGVALSNQGGFYPNVINDALDKLTIQTQQLKSEVDRSAKLPITSTVASAALVTDLIRLGDSANQIDTVAGSITNVNTVATNIANVNTVAGISGNVTTVAGISANVTAVAGNAANVNTVAGSIANVNTVGTNIASVNTTAGSIASVNTTAGSIANVNTVATNIANVNTTGTNITSVNTCASNIAAITAAPGHAAAAAASATASAVSASSSATSATNSSNSALAASASQSAALTSATNSQNSATASASSASASSTSATNSASSASASAVSAAAAAATLASALWRDVVFKVAGDSPIAPTQAENGFLFVVDTSAGNVVFNLPAISSLAMPYNIGIKKQTGDSNTVTINRSGSDTIDGSTSKSIGSQGGTQLLADITPSPDLWTSMDFGLQGGNISVFQVTGNGSLATYNTGTDPGTENNTWVTIDGVTQLKSTYSFSGASITLGANLPNGAVLEVMAGSTLGIGVPSDGTVSTVKLVDGAVTSAKVDATVATVAGVQSLTNKKLGSLTSNGFVKTSSGDGTLSVDTSTYVTSALETGTWAAPSRTIDTIYQNTSGRKRRVFASCYGPVSTANVSWTLKVGSANPPATVLATPGGANGGSSNRLRIVASFEVPNNWYYKIENSENATLEYWSELDE